MERDRYKISFYVSRRSVYSYVRISAVQSLQSNEFCRHPSEYGFAVDTVSVPAVAYHYVFPNLRYEDRRDRGVVRCGRGGSAHLRDKSKSDVGIPDGKYNSLASLRYGASRTRKAVISVLHLLFATDSYRDNCEYYRRSENQYSHNGDGMMINIRELNLTLQKSEILKNISVYFERGKIHGLIGRNGSGKTMLMKCICGFVKPTNGEIFVGGKRIGKDCDFPENVGIIIETPGFIPYYSGFKNLKLLADLRGKISKNDIRKIMEQVGLDPNLNRHVRKYSLGMRQRLGLAQAIMEDPDLLILDEPMNGLDKDGVNDMRQYLLDLKAQGKTILIASHSVEDIDILCDTVCEMDKGTITKIR